LKIFDPSKIFLNPDCGFGTFAERPMNDARVAFAKLQSISEAAKRLRRIEVGIPA
jgi:5-methyltetrahydropteroyltriglutamate--homocysteine methyltransferase